MLQNQKPMLILIAGGTCAGKSTLPKKVKKHSIYPFSILGTDDFVEVEIMIKDEKIKINDAVWIREGITEDNPNGTRWRKKEAIGLSDELNKIKKKDVNISINIEYQWPKPENVDWEQLFSVLKEELNQSSDTQKVIVVEGLHALQNEELRKMADLKIYSHTDDDLRLVLKMTRSPWYKKMVGEPVRDPRNFGGELTPVPFALKSWVNGTIKSEKQHVLPTKQYADLVLEYNESEDLPKNVKKVESLADLYFENKPQFQQKVAELRTETKKQDSQYLIQELKQKLETTKAEKQRTTIFWIIGSILTITTLVVLLVLARRKKAKKTLKVKN